MNYEFKTTFWSDFTIADKFGLDAVKYTFERAFNEWKDNYVYFTELTLVVNWKCWEHYHNKQMEFSKFYSDKYYECREYGLDNLKGKEVEYFINTLD